MKLILTLAILLLSLEPMQLWGQEISVANEASRFAEEVYGLFQPDQQLVNGTQYVNRYPRCLGHPYFGENELQSGSLTLSVNKFDDLLLKYDLVTQDLELEYTHGVGMTNRIIVVPDFVEEFTIGPYYFRKMQKGDSIMRYYQIVSMPAFTCYTYWYKKLIPVIDNLNYLNECTDADRIYWLERDGNVNGFWNRKSFLSLFPESSRREIRKMISRYQIPLNRATVEELVLILKETSQIIEKEDLDE